MNSQLQSVRKIDSLQYLRAFAAIWVLLTHVLQRLDIKPRGVFFSGQWGVDIFFLLSGFIIYLTTRDHSSWKVFAIKRVFRIFPAYLLCLVVYILYSIFYNNIEGYSFLTIVQNVLMIPFSGPIGYNSLIVGQAWSTCYEMYFYFLLALLLLFHVSKKWLLPSILVLFVTFFTLMRIYPSNGFVGYLYSLMGTQHVLFFCEGIIIARFVDVAQRVKISKGFLYSISFIALVVYFYILCNTYNFILSLFISPLFFIIVYKINEVLPGKGIVNAIMVKLGDVSFSIYLIHSVVIRFLLNQRHFDSFILLLFTTISITILLSLISYRFVEKKFIDLGKSISNKL